MYKSTGTALLCLLLSSNAIVNAENGADGTPDIANYDCTDAAVQCSGRGACSGVVHRRVPPLTGVQRALVAGSAALIPLIPATFAPSEGTRSPATTAPIAMATQAPTNVPSELPTSKPTITPTEDATTQPLSPSPSLTPTEIPSPLPIRAPTERPTESPTSRRSGSANKQVKLVSLCKCNDDAATFYSDGENALTPATPRCNYERKGKTMTVCLQAFLGYTGAPWFYLGKTGWGVFFLTCLLSPCFACCAYPICGDEFGKLIQGVGTCLFGGVASTWLVFLILFAINHYNDSEGIAPG